MALPGQRFVNGVSNLLFGTQFPPYYGSSDTSPVTVITNTSIQAQIKAGNFQLIRMALSNSTNLYTDAQIDARMQACANCGCIPLVILGYHAGAAFNQHVVQYLGSRCNLYEMSNEPDINGISWQQYLSFWVSQIPGLRQINSNAAFIGPVLGVVANFNSYLQPWLSGCKSAGVMPDAVSFHDYPCTGHPDQATCGTKAPNIGKDAASLRSLIISTIGYALPIACTEWNIDASDPVIGYSLDPTFNRQWTQTALQSMAQNNVDIACQFDCANGAAHGGDDLINISTGLPGPQYQPMVDSIRSYLGSGGGGGGGGGGVTFSLSPTSLNFTGTLGGSPPSTHTATLTNTGSTSVPWQIATSYDNATGQNFWLSSSPTSGTLAAGASVTITFSAAFGNLAAGTYSATVSFSPSSSTTLPVTFTVSPTGGSVNPLSLFYSNAVSATLSTANQLYDIQGTSPTTNATYTNFGGGHLGYVEIQPQGSTQTPAGSIGSPSGKGFFLDTGTLGLSGDQIVAGNWSAIIRLNASQIGAGFTQAGTLTGDIYVRVYKYNTASTTYTLITSMTSPGQTIPLAFTSFPLSASGVAAIAINSNEVLYVDAWVNVTTNSNTSTAQGIRFNRLSTDTSGHTGDPQAIIVTPGYQTSGVANLEASPSSLNFAGVASVSDPASSQNVTITNTTGSSGSWTSGISYGSGSGWLSLVPSSGTLAAGASQVVAVTASNLTASLAVGTYTATITFTKVADTATVGVTLVVSSSATSIIGASPSALIFSGQVPTNPATQTITISNTGSSLGNWSTVVGYNQGSNWITMTPDIGTLAPAANLAITTGINLSGLSTGTYNAVITFLMGGTSATVSVTLTVSGGQQTLLLTTSGLNLLRNGMSGADNPLITYVALGIGTTAPTATDTQLGNETFRKAVSSYANGVSPGEVLINMFLAPGDAIGSDIEEIGFFGGNSATSAANTGILFAHGLYHHNPKSGTESITFQLDLVL